LGPFFVVIAIVTALKSLLPAPITATANVLDPKTLELKTLELKTLELKTLETSL